MARTEDTTMLITELPFGQPGRIFRSPMPFGTYDPEGVIYEAFRKNEISMIVLLAEDHECKEKAGRDLKALYTQDGFTVVHLPIVDFGIPKTEDLRIALHATVREAQAGRHIAIHCSAGIGRTGLFAACLAKKLLNLPGEQAIEWVRRHIPHAVETSGQRRFVAGGTVVACGGKKANWRARTYSDWKTKEYVTSFPQDSTLLGGTSDGSGRMLHTEGRRMRGSPLTGHGG